MDSLANLFPTNNSDDRKVRWDLNKESDHLIWNKDSKAQYRLQSSCKNLEDLHFNDLNSKSSKIYDWERKSFSSTQLNKET